MISFLFSSSSSFLFAFQICTVVPLRRYMCRLLSCVKVGVLLCPFPCLTSSSLFVALPVVGNARVERIIGFRAR